MTTPTLTILESIESLRDQHRLAFLESRWSDAIAVGEKILTHADKKQIDVDRVIWTRDKARDHLAGEGM